MVRRCLVTALCLCAALTLAMIQPAAALAAALSVTDVSQKAIANLGWKDIALTAPVFPGDTIYARTTVTDVRASKSRPHQGIVTTRTEGYKADGTVFLSFERVSLVPKRGAGVKATK